MRGMSERNTIFKRREVQNINNNYISKYRSQNFTKNKSILRYFGNKNQIGHFNNAKRPNNLANAVGLGPPPQF